MSEDLCFLSAAELRGRITAKEISPVEVTRAVLARAETLQPELNCFITLCGELAWRKRAPRSARSWQASRSACSMAFP
jgi:Asp-tRNA(Asn)/Glu-tRNA(Gln) amidotransferase A subunit family amidase